MNFNAFLGRNLRLARTAARMTQAAAAEVAGVTQSALSQLEGGTTGASAELISKLAAAYRVPVDLLYPPTAHDGPRKARQVRAAG